MMVRQFASTGVASAERLTSASRRFLPTMTLGMADETQIPLDAQLEEIGAQLDWVRGYL